MKKIYTNHDLCSGCRACTVACAIAHTGEADPSRGAIQILRNAVEGYEFQAVCRQCEDPECVAACMAAALSVDPGDGGVLFDRDRCIGCWMCLMACPHHAIVRDEPNRKAIRCDRCEGRETPACVAACATFAVQAIVDE